MSLAGAVSVAGPGSVGPLGPRGPVLSRAGPPAWFAWSVASGPVGPGPRTYIAQLRQVGYAQPEHPNGRRGPVFPWARMGTAAFLRAAADAGLHVIGQWRHADRAFVCATAKTTSVRWKSFELSRTRGGFASPATSLCPRCRPRAPEAGITCSLPLLFRATTARDT
jgi:hypothetical protein